MLSSAKFTREKSRKALATYGAPEQVETDNGSLFTSK